MRTDNGWCITLLSDEHQKTNINNRKNNKYLTWSPYDRIMLKIIPIVGDDGIKNFILPSENDIEWCGVKQQLHLIPLKCYNIKKNKENGFTINRNWSLWKTSDENLLFQNNQETFGVYALYTVKAPQAKKNNYKKNNNLNNIVSAYIKKIKNKQKSICLFFDSLGSEDLAIIVLANDIYTLSCMSVTLTDAGFENINTIAGLNKYDTNIDPEMSAKVLIEIKEDHRPSDVAEELSKVLKSEKYNISMIFNTAKTIEFDIKNCSTCHYWTKNGPFNGESDFYNKYITRSRTYWYCDFLQEKTYDLLISKNKELGSIVNKNAISSQEHKLGFDNPMELFIYREYERSIELKQCKDWQNILIWQKEAFKECIEHYEKEGNKNIPIYEEARRHIVEDMQTVLIHINQACAPISEIANRNHYYFGSFNKILKMYYGIISAIVNIGYMIPRGNEKKQSDIHFGIKFGATKKIFTKMYLVPNHFSRIVIFNIPYSSFYNIKETTVRLVHEVFHYIAPINRVHRNKCIINTWICFLSNELTSYIVNELGDEEMSQNIGILLRENLQEIENKVNQTLESSFKYIKNIESVDFQDPGTDFIELVFVHILSGIITILHSIENQYDGTFNRKIKALCEVVFKCDEKIIDNNPFNKKIRLSFEEWYLLNRRGYYYMGALAMATKETFCDLAMCKIFNLNFHEYINLFINMEDGIALNAKNVEEDDALIYRWNAIGQILEKIDIVNYNAIDANKKNVYKVIQQLKNKSLRQEREKELISQIIKTFQYEIQFFDQINNYNSYNKIRNLIDKLRCIVNNDTKTLKNYWEAICNFENESLPDNKYTGSVITNGITTTTTNKRNQCYSNNIDKDILFIDGIDAYISVMCKKLSSNINGSFWYRGVCNDSYSLLPNLFRNIDNDLSLYANQANILKLAYEHTMNLPEIWQRPMTERMCLLQHYGLPTNLLDFSTDMLMALYFAINPDDTEDKKKVNSGEFCPIVYIFNPQKYAMAIEALKNGIPNNSSIYRKISPIIYDVEDNMMILANLGQRSCNSRTMFPKYTDSVLKLFGQEHCPIRTSWYLWFTVYHNAFSLSSAGG